jgi:serine protease inhibitor
MRNKMRKLSTFLSFAAIALAAIQCQPSEDIEPNLPDLSPLQTIELNTVQGGNNFAFDLFRNVVDSEPKSTNVFVSPFSVSMALAMASNGANAELRADMATILGYANLSQSEVNSAFKSLESRVQKMDNRVQFNNANSVWYRNGKVVKNSFVEVLKNYFKAEIRGEDFQNPQTVNKINNWVSNKTQGKIPSIIDQINPDHVMFLINALYFKADWKIPFDPKETQNRPFYLSAGQTVEVPTMKAKKGNFRYGSFRGFELLDIPYGNGQFSMTVIMPVHNGSGIDLDYHIKTLNVHSLNEFLESSAEVSYELYFPKFKVEYEVTLNSALTEMGMGAAFNGINGGFSEIFDDTQHYIIDEVKHKTFIEVNEQGTEAAAVTSIGIEVTSLPSAIRVNRPFLYLIREKHTDAILFIGKMENPLL